ARRKGATWMLFGPLMKEAARMRAEVPLRREIVPAFGLGFSRTDAAIDLCKLRGNGREDGQDGGAGTRGAALRGCGRHGLTLLQFRRPVEDDVACLRYGIWY